VQAGKVDLAISYEPEVLLARDKGARVAAIGALVQQPLTSIISLRGKVKSAADLRGKTIGTAGIPYQAAYLKTILARAGVPESRVKVINVGFNLVPALLSKKVDAILGGYWNYEGVELALAKRRPTILKVDELGVPTYQELVFVANFDDLHNEGTTLRRFLQAVSRGARAVQRDPSVGVDALLKANPALERPLQEAAVAATMPAFLPADKAFPWGFMNPDQWLAYGRWMLAQGLIDRLPSPVSLTNEYLPGRGV
jgi:putative hydroxymethylpyrimidine transport system substrate-binding protein